MSSRREPTRRTASLVILAAVTALTACTGTQPTGPEELANAADATIPADDGPTGSSLPAAPSPGDGADQETELSVIERHLGFSIPGFGGGDDLDLRRLEQDTIAACMRSEGFDYVAWVEDPSVVAVPVEEGLDHESREFAARYGFGVSTQAYAQSDVGPGLAGHTGDGSGVDLEADPNAAIRAGLSPGELLAYERAFFGAESPMFGGPVEDEDAPGGVLEARQMVSHGCIGEAQRAIDGQASGVLDVFADQILGMENRAYADPRYVSYAEDVERCVHLTGFDFYANEPAWATLAYFDELVSQFDQRVGGSPFDQLDEDELAELTALEIDALYDVPRDIPDDLLDDLAEIQDLETRTAVAVWDCGGSAADQRRVIGEILVGMEATFIEENADELERFRR